MLSTLGLFVANRPWRFVVGHLVLVLLCVPVISEVMPHLKGGGFEDDGAESWQTKDLIERELGQGAADIVALYRAPDGSSVDDVEVLGEVLAAVAHVEADPLTESVDSLYTTGAPWLVSKDRHNTAVTVTLKGAEHEKQKALLRLKTALTPDPSSGIVVQFTGIILVNEAVATAMADDLVQGELFALPITLLVLLWVFRGVVAAGLPLLMGICANLVAFAALRGLTLVTDVSIFAANIVTLLALGLAIDCSLFVVTRFREELRAHPDDVPGAVSRSMGSAGRAVFFSGVVVGLSMMAMMAMPQMMIRSLGYAGVVVVVSTMGLMIFLLPAVLSLLGHKVEALRLPLTGAGQDDGTFFFALAKKVMKHPVVVVVVVGGGLVVLAAPFLRMVPSIPDYRALPHDAPVRAATEAFNHNFLPNQMTPHDVVVVVDGDIFDRKNLQRLLDVQKRMEAIPGVIAVQSAFTAQEGVSPASVADLLATRRDALDPSMRSLLARFLNGHYARFVVLSEGGYNSPVTATQVRLLRVLNDSGGGSVSDPNLVVKVAGAPAILVDLLDRLEARAPFALALVGVAMFLVLFLAFGSIVVPLKAIVMNCLSMTASFGALVWVFQDGRFQNLLHYESMGFTDATTPLVMFCLVFGLSMDYEVLLLGRIREEAVRAGKDGDTEDAVAIGLMKTGRTITSAALLLMVVVGAFGFSQVLSMKMLGLGIAVSVALDATVVRAVLVPATMKLLGRWNWWPGRLHDEQPEKGPPAARRARPGSLRRAAAGILCPQAGRPIAAVAALVVAAVGIAVVLNGSSTPAERPRAADALTVTTDPADATVFIDHVEREHHIDANAGPHNVRVVRAGYQTTEDTVVVNGPTTLNVRLRKLAVASPRIEAVSPPVPPSKKDPPGRSAMPSSPPSSVLLDDALLRAIEAAVVAQRAEIEACPDDGSDRVKLHLVLRQAKGRVQALARADADSVRCIVDAVSMAEWPQAPHQQVDADVWVWRRPAFKVAAH